MTISELGTFSADSNKTYVEALGQNVYSLFMWNGR